ncbi:MAG: regulatory protein RecX [Clostridia bacterium]|nr:regulatory protein RecX [Clostridia bacterium]
MIIQTVFLRDGMVYVVLTPDELSVHSEGLRMSLRNWKKFCEQYLPDALSDEAFTAAQGHPIGEAEYDELHRLSEMTEAVLEAARILSSGDKSERDLRRKLKPKFSEESIDSAVRLLKKRGYLDETAQCLRIAEAAVRTKHHGPARIKADLIAHGYSGTAADAAIREIPEEDFADALAYCIDRKFPDIENMDTADVKKAAASLMRLGFSSGAIFDEIRIRRKNR